MRFRKLRIAWSAFWGLACVLLIVLWVRSYRWIDKVYRVGTVNTTILDSDFGDLILNRVPVLTPADETEWNFVAREHCGSNSTPLREQFRLRSRFTWLASPNRFLGSAPHSFFAVMFGVAFAMPWIRWRF